MSHGVIQSISGVVHVSSATLNDSKILRSHVELYGKLDRNPGRDMIVLAQAFSESVPGGWWPW